MPSVATIENAGKKAICYMSVGSAEDWRPDVTDNTDCYSNKDCYEKIGSKSKVFEANIEYFKWLANTTHSYGMKIGLKNSNEMISHVLDLADFSISESCSTYTECDTYSPFVKNKKPAWGVAYHSQSSKDCRKATKYGVQLKFCSGDGNICYKHKTLHDCAV